MNHFPIKLLPLFFVLLVTTARGDLTMNLETESSGEKQPLTMKVSASGIRIQQKNGAVIMLPVKHQMLMVDDNRKMVMVMKMPEGEKTADPTAPVGKITKTSRQEVINGFVCEQFLATDNAGHSSQLWISKNGPDMAAFIEMGKSMQGVLGSGPDPSMKWLHSAMVSKELSHFPIRTVTDGSKTTVVSFKSDSLPAAEFAVPSGYQTMDMPSMSVLIRQARGLKTQSVSENGINPEQIKAFQEAAMKAVHGQ